MEHTERFITILEDALIAARQKVVEVESRLARMRAVSSTDQDARYYHIQALEMWEKAERLKAERDVIIERIMVADCPYESCQEKPEGIIGCDACWRDWSVQEAARRRQAKNIVSVAKHGHSSKNNNLSVGRAELRRFINTSNSVEHSHE